VLQRPLLFFLGCSICKQCLRNNLSDYVIANFGIVTALVGKQILKGRGVSLANTFSGGVDEFIVGVQFPKKIQAFKVPSVS
jgi:hypothetical protein